MKKILFALLGMLVLTACGTIREIEYDATDEDGAHVRITSANRLFYGCGLRVCEYTPKGGKTLYALELDIEDRVLRVSKGDLLTIRLANGKNVTLQNLYDAQSEVTQTIVDEAQTHLYTDMVPVYDVWYDAVYAIPVTTSYHTTRPVVRQDSFVKLYYIIHPDQLQEIISNEVKSVVIATDRETIEKDGEDLPEILQVLMNLFKN